MTLKKQCIKKIRKGMAIVTMVICVGLYVQSTYAYHNTERRIYSIREDNYAPAYYGLIQSGIVSKDDYEDLKGFEKIEEAYRLYITQYYEKGLVLDISIEEFEELYRMDGLDKLKEYVYEIENYGISTLSSSSSTKYYYNTGSNMPSQCSYSKYRLLSVVKKGDFIYEPVGGFGITGHSAIVEGRFYDANSGKYYIRVIEAISEGVVRSVLDDTRCDDKSVYVYRVKDATSENIKLAVLFAICQLEKDYALDLKKDTSINEEDWYCSELVWAAYKYVGINLERSLALSDNEPGVSPRDIAYGPYSLYVSYYK